MIKHLYKKYKFDISSDRLGPDCIFTHWRLYFRTMQEEICKKKFKLFGKGAEFRPGAYAVTCSKISLGRNVIIRPGSMLFADPRSGEEGEILIDDDVMIGSGVHFYVANHKFDCPHKAIIHQGHYPAKTITVRRGAWIGANCIILPGVTIGVNAVVGAGSIVTKDVPDGYVVAGNPAKIIRRIGD